MPPRAVRQSYIRLRGCPIRLIALVAHSQGATEIPMYSSGLEPQRRKEIAMTTKIVLLLFSIALGSSALTGCNTIQGAGQDVSKAGSKVSEEAQEHKKY
jgi:predicted small secreted protein